MSQQEKPWKEPKQARSKQRFNTILDASALLFKEVGYENATTNAIAERANVPIGSVYQYFGSKEILLQALSARYLNALRSVYETAFPADPSAMTLEEILDVTLDPFIEFELQQPGFSNVFLSAEVSADVAQATHELDEAILQQIQRMIQAHATHLPNETARMKAKVVKTIIKGMMGLISAADDGQSQARLSAEMKQVIARYVGNS